MRRWHISASREQTLIAATSARWQFVLSVRHGTATAGLMKPSIGSPTRRVVRRRTTPQTDCSHRPSEWRWRRRHGCGGQQRGGASIPSVRTRSCVSRHCANDASISRRQITGADRQAAIMGATARTHRNRATHPEPLFSQ